MVIIVGIILSAKKYSRYKCSNLGVAREKIHGGYVRLT